MDIWTMAGIVALALVICAGTVIKLYTHNKVKELEGTFDVKDNQKARSQEKRGADAPDTKGIEDAESERKF